MNDNHPTSPGLNYDQVQNLIDERLRHIRRQSGSHATAQRQSAGRRGGRASWYKRFKRLLGLGCA